MKFINLTPHAVTIFKGEERIEIPSSGEARVDVVDEPLNPAGGIPVISAPIFGPVEGLPEPQPGVGYIVSGIVLQHPDVASRDDVFAPATGPKHGAVRDAQNRISGVTRLVAAKGRKD